VNDPQPTLNPGSYSRWVVGCLLFGARDDDRVKVWTAQAMWLFMR